MVAEGGEEGLVDGTANELLVEIVVSKHVNDRVRHALRPEAVALLHIVADVVRLRLASIGKYRVIVGRSNVSDAVSQLAGEEVIPGSVAVSLVRRVADEHLVELAAVASSLVGRGLQVTD